LCVKKGLWFKKNREGCAFRIFTGVYFSPHFPQKFCAGLRLLPPQVAYGIYRKLERYPEALRTAMLLTDGGLIKETFEACDRPCAAPPPPTTWSRPPPPGVGGWGRGVPSPAPDWVWVIWAVPCPALGSPPFL